MSEIPWESIFDKIVLFLNKWFVLFFLQRTVSNHALSLFWPLGSLESIWLPFSSLSNYWEKGIALFIQGTLSARHYAKTVYSQSHKSFATTL